MRRQQASERRRRRGGLTALAAVAAAVAALCLVLFVPPPTWLVRSIAVRNAPWLLSDYMEAPSGLMSYARNGARKFTAMYVQYGLAAAFRRSHPMPPNTDDARRIAEELVALRRVMLNQGEVPHAPAQWSSILSGVGYCDQMNAIAANVLGGEGEYAHAQIVALRNPATRAEHTIGRVWSAATREWLYFDLWEDVAVFRLGRDGVPQMLERRAVPSTVDPAERAAITGMYAFASSGVTFNEYPPTFGQFVFQRLGWSVARKTTESFVTDAAVSAVSASGIASHSSIAVESAPEIRRKFAEAQVASVVDGNAAARPRYLLVAKTDTMSVLGRAALLLGGRKQ